MAVVAPSKVSAQGRISIAAEIRQKLGIEPGSTVEWEEEGNKIVVRRASLYSSADIARPCSAREGPER